MVTLGENSHCSTQNKPASPPSSLGTIHGVTWGLYTQNTHVSIGSADLKSFTVGGENAGSVDM